MNYTYQVYYFDPKIKSWKQEEKYKLIKAKNKKQAIKKFNEKYPQYKGYLAW